MPNSLMVIGGEQKKSKCNGVKNFNLVACFGPEDRPEQALQ